MTFLIATPSPVTLFVAALQNEDQLPAIRDPWNDQELSFPFSSFTSRNYSAVMSSPDYPISSLTKLLRHIVTLINNEVLVEDLEDLAALNICHTVAASLLAERVKD